MAKTYFRYGRFRLNRYRVVFLTGPALKVLSVEDGKIPTKKVKSKVSQRNLP